MGKHKKLTWKMRLKISKERKAQINKHYVIDKEVMDNFYKSKQWALCKEWVYKKYIKVCVYCGSTKNLSVDHVRPISCHPKLALKVQNMQIACLSCNRKKSYIMRYNKKTFDLSKFVKDSKLEPLEFERGEIYKFFKKKESKTNNT